MAAFIILCGIYWGLSCLILGPDYRAYPNIEAYAAETETQETESDRFDHHIVTVEIPQY